MNKDFYTAVEERRSIYGLAKHSGISNEKIEALVNYSVKHCPTAYNSQSNRVVVLFGDHHQKLWDITLETLRKIVPESNFSSTEAKIKSFANGHGTIMYFEELTVIENLQEQFPLYKDNFPIWSLQALGMLQYIIWTSLEIEGLGASLQHYNPLINEAVAKEWSLPASWKLNAQMPFGNPTALPGAKDFQPLEERVKVFK